MQSIPEPLQDSHIPVTSTDYSAGSLVVMRAWPIHLSTRKFKCFTRPHPQALGLLTMYIVRRNKKQSKVEQPFPLINSSF